MKHFKKRGSEFLSWVLLIALAVALSTMVFIWTKDFFAKETEQTIKVVYDTSECNSVSLRIDNVCQDLTFIKLNITNNNKRDINRLIFRVYDIYGNPENRDYNITIRPDAFVEMNVMKQGTADKFEIVPAIYKNELDATKTEIVCRASIAQQENIEFCP